jgi:hypothetical protein
MSRFNKIFGGDSPGEPDWMREFARGGDPSVHKAELSWPAVGFAAYNGQASKKKCTQAEVQPARAAKSPTRESRAALPVTANAYQGRAKGGKDGGGCSCGGSGNCKSEGGKDGGGCSCGGDGKCNSEGGGGGPGHVSARGGKAGTGASVEVTPSKIANIPGLVATLKEELAEGRVVATEAELEKILQIALSSLRPSNRRPSDRRLMAPVVQPPSREGPTSPAGWRRS